MQLLSSLTNRIFLASALLATASIGAAVYFVSNRLTREAESELERDLVLAGNLVEQERASLVERFALTARLIADSPVLKAALDTRDAPTVQPIAEEYRRQFAPDFFAVTDRGGTVLAALGAGEPLDEPTHRWITDALGIQVVDHYWQTETGWPILTSVPGVERTPIKFGSPSFPAYGYDLQLLRESDAGECGVDEKGVVAVVPPLPPGVMSTVWGDDERFVQTYFKDFKNIYSTFDWGIRDKDGYYFILGRTDDVINVAGHRLGTREIEEALQRLEQADVAFFDQVGKGESAIDVLLGDVDHQAQVGTDHLLAGASGRFLSRLPLA